MTADADIAVIGAGLVGLSTAFALTERGASVTVYERRVPGNGQSGGDSRIFRHRVVVCAGRGTVALARRGPGAAGGAVRARSPELPGSW